MRHSFAVRLSLRFMFILTVSVMTLSVLFLLFVRSLVQNGQTEELKNAETSVFATLDALYTNTPQNQATVASNGVIMTDIPYYLTYIVYFTKTQEIITTNDPFLPILEDSGGKALRYIVEDYFFDGNLDILYYAASHDFNGTKITVAVAMNMDNNSSAMLFSKLPPAIMLMILPVLILSFLLSFLLTKNTITPVVRITKAAQSMTTEKLNALLPVTGSNDEIDELSRTFNELFSRIKADFDRERQFSSDVSHELNTPLTVISGQTNLLLRWGKNDPEQLEKSLNAIKNESKSMQAIIQNLLQISRIESGRIKPQIGETNIRELFARITEEFASIAPDAKITVKHNDSDIDEILLNTDEEMLHQILTILVSNSVKFSGEKCNIVLNVAKTENGVIITESDDGPGISEESLPHIFERFYRADEARKRNGGSGLGLAIAKTLADTLDAKITAENTEPHGAVFRIAIPN